MPHKISIFDLMILPLGRVWVTDIWATSPYFTGIVALLFCSVMLRMMCHYFSCSKWALFSWCAASCKSAIGNSCNSKVQSNMVANRVIKCELHWNWCLNMIEFVTWNPRWGWQPPEPMNRFTGIHRKGGGADDGLWDHFDFHWDISIVDVLW